MKNQKEKTQAGFILPLSVLLTVILTMSGLNFLHLDYLEERAALNAKDNHAAFYLANTGVQRALESFKANVSNGNVSWTNILNDPDSKDSSGDLGLCPDPDNRGCVIPKFGAVVSGAGSLGFEGTFDDGSYEVRAFDNDDSGLGTNDTDGKINLRARGMVRGEMKLLELQGVQGISGLKLVNCEGDSGAPCPEIGFLSGPDGKPSFLPGRGPASTNELPTWNPDYYDPEQSIGNLPCSKIKKFNASTTINADNLQSGTCYVAAENITLTAQGCGHEVRENIVVFSHQDLAIDGGGRSDSLELRNSIMIALEDMQLQKVTLKAPKTSSAVLPAVISGETISKGSGTVKIYGNVFAGESVGTKKKPIVLGYVEGTVTAEDVFLSSYITDNGDVLNYGFMPGFSYPQELVTNKKSGNWRELE